MSAVSAFVSVLAKALYYVALAAGALMMLLVTSDVIGRTLFNHPLPGTGEITANYLMIAAAFLPWAWVMREDAHITADLFTKWLPAVVRRALDSVVDVITGAYTLLFTWQAGLQAGRKTASNEMLEIIGGYLPVWPVRWLLPVAGVAMVLVLALRILQRLSGVDPSLKTILAPGSPRQKA